MTKELYTSLILLSSILPKNILNLWSEWDLNPKPPDCNSDALTTRPRFLLQKLLLCKIARREFHKKQFVPATSCKFSYAFSKTLESLCSSSLRTLLCSKFVQNYHVQHHIYIHKIASRLMCEFLNFKYGHWIFSPCFCPSVHCTYER